MDDDNATSKALSNNVDVHVGLPGRETSNEAVLSAIESLRCEISSLKSECFHIRTTMMIEIAQVKEMLAKLMGKIYTKDDYVVKEETDEERSRANRYINSVCWDEHPDDDVIDVVRKLGEFVIRLNNKRDDEAVWKIETNSFFIEEITNPAVPDHIVQSNFIEVLLALHSHGLQGTSSNIVENSASQASKEEGMGVINSVLNDIDNNESSTFNTHLRKVLYAIRQHYYLRKNTDKEQDTQDLLNTMYKYATHEIMLEGLKTGVFCHAHDIPSSVDPDSFPRHFMWMVKHDIELGKRSEMIGAMNDLFSL